MLKNKIKSDTVKITVLLTVSLMEKNLIEEWMYDKWQQVTAYL